MSYEEIKQKLREVITMIESTSNPMETFFRLRKDGNLNYFIIPIENEDHDKDVIPSEKELKLMNEMKRVKQNIDAENAFQGFLSKSVDIKTGKQLGKVKVISSSADEIAKEKEVILSRKIDETLAEGEKLINDIKNKLRSFTQDDFKEALSKAPNVVQSQIMLDDLVSFFNKLKRRESGLTTGVALHRSYISFIGDKKKEDTIYTDSMFRYILRGLLPEYEVRGPKISKGWRLEY